MANRTWVARMSAYRVAWGWVHTYSAAFGMGPRKYGLHAAYIAGYQRAMKDAANSVDRFTDSLPDGVVK